MYNDTEFGRKPGVRERKKGTDDVWFLEKKYAGYTNKCPGQNLTYKKTWHYFLELFFFWVRTFTYIFNTIFKNLFRA